MSRFIDIHVLQTLPPSNPNRDDTGAPKTATFGGVRRMRISSQAIKRATREDFEKRAPEGNRGIRTKLVVELVRAAIVERAPQLAQSAAELAEMGLVEIGFKLTEPKRKKNEETTDQKLKEAGFLVFLSAKQIEHLAEALVSVADAEDRKKAFKALKPKTLVDTDHSISIALFGRMVAEPNSLNVDAACQVAHALGVGEVEYEKKRNDEADEGAGMIGTIEFASATVYRYATINVDLLEENLGSVDAADDAVRLFIDSFVRAMPTGKVTTFANRTLPDAVVVQVRDDQPINLVGAFEEPVPAKAAGDGTKKGFAGPAVKRLVAFEKDMRALTGMTPKASLVAWTTHKAESIAELGQQVRLVDLGGSAVDALRGQQ